MEPNKELLEKAKTAKSAEELGEIAKAAGMELPPEKVAELFASLHQSGELSDEELDNVSGGCAKPSPVGYATSLRKVEYRYAVGQPVEVIKGWSTKSAVIVKRFPYNSEYNAYYYPKYTVRYKDNTQEDVWQSDIELS